MWLKIPPGDSILKALNYTVGRCTFKKFMKWRDDWFFPCDERGTITAGRFVSISLKLYIGEMFHRYLLDYLMIVKDSAGIPYSKSYDQTH